MQIILSFENWKMKLFKSTVEKNIFLTVLTKKAQLYREKAKETIFF